MRRCGVGGGHRRRLMDRLAYPYIGSTAAEISVHGFVDLLVGRLRMFHEQRRGGHDLSSLAIPALRHVDFFPGLLQGMRAVRRESLNSGDMCVGYGGYWRDARALGLPPDMHRASAALADAATVLSTVEIEYIPKYP